MLKYGWLIAVILFAVLNNRLVAAEIAPLSLVLNSEPRGEYFVVIRGADDVLVSRSDIEQLGIKASGELAHIDGIDYVSLFSLRHYLSYAVDEKSSSLILNVDPRFLAKTVKDYSGDLQARDTFAIDSAFVNYSLIRRGLEQEEFSSFELPIEAVIHSHAVSIKTNFVYHESPGLWYWQRGISNATFDYPTHMRRLVVGDFPATSGELGGSGIFAGLSFSRNFAMSTRFNRFPGINVSGLLESPSRVDVYANDMLLRTEHLPAGEYELSNLPNVYGAGETKVVVTDAFGRQQTYSDDFYVSTRVLKPGLHDFSYNLGIKRIQKSILETQYESNPAFLGYHFYGVNNWLTWGMRFGLNEDVVNVRPGLIAVLKQLGEIEMLGAYSQSDMQQGQAGVFRYSFGGRVLHFRLGVTSMSENYLHTSSTENTVNTRLSRLAGIGFHSLPIGSLALTYTAIERYAESPVETFTLLYSKRLARMTTLLARAVRRIEQGDISDSIYFSINAVIGRHSSMNYSYTQQDEQFTRAAYVQKNVTVGPGAGFRVRAWEDETAHSSDDLKSELSANLKAKHMSLAGLYINSGLSRSYQASAAGSVSFIDNRFFLSRPVQDSFALVKVGALDGVSVYQNSELMGKTKKGVLLVPSLVSYADNDLSINGEDVPVEVALNKTKQFITPAYRTGVVASFEAKRFQGVQGKIYFVKKDKRKTADFAEISVLNTAPPQVSIVGTQGEFYFENLSPGAHQARVMLDNNICEVRFQVPESDEMLIELGDLECMVF